MSLSFYSAGLNSHGANIPSYPTKADAIKAAKAAARSQSGKLAVFFATIYPRGGSTVEERRVFRADERGKVTEVK